LGVAASFDELRDCLGDAASFEELPETSTLGGGPPAAKPAAKPAVGLGSDSEDRTELPRSTGTARVNGGGTAMPAPSRLSGTEFDCGSDAERRGVDDGLVSEW
jgi:hypothetical protein